MLDHFFVYVMEPMEWATEAPVSVVLTVGTALTEPSGSSAFGSVAGCDFRLVTGKGHD